MSDDGYPICPVDDVAVAEPGFFCSEECWRHIHILAALEQTVIDVDQYRDVSEQPWHE